jgi:tRNA threonylcarbamoyladenosine biosynthesis protein TsaE
MATVITHSERETEGLARRLASHLRPGDVIRLSGGLGAGKTAFVRGLAEGLDVDPDDVSSPTFALIHEYRGRMPLFHADLYRLGVAAAAELGLDEIGAGSGVLAIEWPDRLTDPIPNAIDVTIETVDDTTRRIVISDTPFEVRHGRTFEERTIP